MEATHFFIGVIFYILGFASGFFLNRILDKTDRKYDGIVLLAVTGVWAMSMVYDMMSNEYTTNPMVHALMGAIVGFFYKPVKKIGE